MEEHFVPVKGYEEFYSVSNFGTIRRERGGLGAKKRGCPLKPGIVGRGYLGVVLWKNKKPKCCRVHRIVADVFLGDCPIDYQVNHKDGNKKNNSASNLEYVSCKQNMRHAIRNGLFNPNNPQKGIKNGSSKLKNSDVIFIRNNYIKGKNRYKDFAERFNVSVVTVGLVVNNKKWKHI